MKKSRRGLSLALILALVLTLALPAMAAEEEPAEGLLTRGDAILALFGAFGDAGEYPPSGFTDVPEEGELSTAMGWAAVNKVVYGYGGGVFGPEDPVTREQLAAILYRYAQALGKGFQGMWMFLLDYPDAAEISPWADEAMHWMVMNGVLAGSEEGIFPKGTVTAEEAREMVERFTAAVADEEAGPVLENAGLTLTVPADKAELVIAVVPEAAEDGTLFSAAEKASVEAAEAMGEEDTGAGWLFSIRRVSEAELQELLCYDMSGMEVFARDAEGGCYLYCHPTDVRYVRETPEEMTADQEQWAELCGWAAGIPEAFLAENEGLEPFTAGNSEVEIVLNRILCGLETYAVSTTEFGPLEPGETDPAPFLEKLLTGVTYTYVDGEAPDGEYVVLQLPEQETRYDFFTGDKTLIRRVVTIGDDSFESLYRAEFADGETTSTAVMSAWYDALAQAQGLK